MHKKDVGFGVMCGVIGSLMTMALGFVVPLGAQSESDIYFRKVTCGSLEVVRPDGTALVSIDVGETGGRIRVKSEQQFLGRSTFFPSMVSMGVNEHGGYVVVSEKEGKGKAKMEVNEHGNGAVSVWRGGWFTQGEWKDAFSGNEEFK